MNPRMNRIARVAPDPIARLRRLRGEHEPASDDVRVALTRLFKTADGRVLLDYLVSQSYARRLPSDAPESALRENEVRKNFLDQILAQAEEPLDRRNADRPNASAAP
ncbi:MAG: hypothetical protein E6R03_12175 [Hyphomicrobiaceae bacterium]|nr:MAG: hypothetical protein E6R03_12175 [Hyphomicrobiaceae bacterium]